jgi:hypothetical protein
MKLMPKGVKIDSKINETHCIFKKINNCQLTVLQIVILVFAQIKFCKPQNMRLITKGISNDHDHDCLFFKFQPKVSNNLGG